jgi:hypothetical protein
MKMSRAAIAQVLLFNRERLSLPSGMLTRQNNKEGMTAFGM